MAFVVDAREGVTAVDSEVAKLLAQVRQAGADRREQGRQRRRGAGTAGEAFSLGFDDVFPVSASHGRGVSQFLDAVVARLPEAAASAALRAAPPPRRDDEDRADPHRLHRASRTSASRRWSTACWARSACWCTTRRGRRAIRSTRPFSFGGREYVLVDTAGMRRRRSIDTRAEHVSAAMARDQIDRCDVAVLVVDAREAATAEDARLAGEIEASGRGALVVLNKKDLVGRRDMDKKIADHPRGAGVPRLRAGHRHVRGHARRRHRHRHRGDPHLRRGVEARPDRRAQQAVRGHRRPPAAARRSRRPPRPPLLRHPGQHPPADLLRQHEPRRRHRPLLPALPGEPVPQGLRLRGHARAAGLPRPRPEEARRRRGRGRLQKRYEARAVAVNEKGFVPRFSGSDSRSAGSNR